MASFLSRKKSPIWEFFTVLESDNGIAVCDVCSSQISRGSKNPHYMTTKNLTNHLRIHHESKYRSYLKLITKEPCKENRSNPYFKNFIKTATTGETESEKRNSQELENDSDEPEAVASCSENDRHNFDSDADDAVASCSKRPRVENIKKRTLQPTIKEVYEKRSMWPINCPKAKGGNKAIAELICGSILPYSIVEDKFFIRAINYFEPRYPHRSRKYFTESVIPQIYEKLKLKLKTLLTTANYISLTSDGWTSKHSVKSFMSLTAHWVDSDFNYQSAALKCASLPTAHNAVNIGQFITDSLAEWQIPLSKVHLLVRDNAAAMTVAMKHCGLENNSLGCAIHTLQLCIQDKLFKEQKSVSDMLTVARGIATHFRHSSTAKTTLTTLQKQLKLPVHAIIQDVQTRWNSTSKMLKRIVEQKQALILFCANTEKLRCLTAHEFLLAEKLLPILEAFENVTDEMSYDKASVSMLIPMIVAMEKYLKVKEQEPSILLKNIIGQLRNNFSLRFQNYKTNRKLLFATVLDPRFKLKYFPTLPTICQLSQENVKGLLIDEYMNLLRNDELDAEANSTTADLELDSRIIPISNIQKEDNNIWSGFFENDTENDISVQRCRNLSDSTVINVCNNILDDRATCLRNVNEYLLMTDLPRSGCPFNWWKLHKDVLGSDDRHKLILSRLAQQYLGSPPSSVFSERLFSTAGQINDCKRSRLTEDHSEHLLFCYYNLQYFSCEY